MAGKVLTQIISIAGKMDPSVAKSVKKAEKTAGGLGKGLKKALAAGAVAAAGLATGLGAAAAKGIQMGSDVQKSMNQLAASTGTYGDDLKKLGAAAQAAYKNNFGESLDDVAESMAAVKKTIGGTDEELQRSTESALMFRDVFGAEVGESANAAKTMMEQFGISADEAYGLMAYGAQNGADKNGDLIDTLNEYSSQYSAMGLSAEQMMQSLVSGAESGQWSIDKVGDAVKELNVRAKDGSDSTAEAFKAIGLDADKMGKAFAKGGKAGNRAFFETVAALEKMQDPMEKNAAAVALFGTQYEDMESSILPTLAKMKGASIDTAGTLAQINEVKYSDLGSAIEGIRRKAETSLMPMAEKMASALTDFEPAMTQAIDAAVPVLEGLVDRAGAALDTFGPMAAGALEAIAPAASEIASTALPVLRDLGGTLLPQLMGVVTGTVIPTLQQVASAVIPPLTRAIQQVWPAAQQVGETLVNVLGVAARTAGDVLQGLLPIVTPLIDTFATLLSTAILPLANKILELGGTVIPIVGNAIRALMPVLNPIVGVVQGIVNAVSSLCGWLGSVVDKARSAADALGKALSGDLGGAAKALGFAKGGFTSGVAIAGEDPNYPVEAVLSFNPAYRAQNIRYWEMAGHMLGVGKSAQMYASGGFTNTTAASVGKSLAEGGEDPWPEQKGGSSYFDFNGVSFSPTIVVQGGDRQDVLAALREARDEFGDFLAELAAEIEEGAIDG